MPSQLKITAILAVRNEALYMRRALQHLSAQGIKVIVIDNESTDDTLQIAQEFYPQVVEQILSYPFAGEYDWQGLLTTKDKLRRTLDADWIIHQDADEILQSPEPGETLYQAICRVDQLGYDAINFDEFVFIYETNDIDYADADYVARMRHYYFFENRKNRLIRAFSNKLQADNLANAGHGPPLHAVQLYPRNFILRHYISLSYEHAKKKYLERIFNAEELKRGWHRNRLSITDKRLQAPPLEKLHHLKSESATDQLPVATNAQTRHFWDWPHD